MFIRELKILKIKCSIIFWKIVNLFYIENKSNIKFIIEKEDWAIRRVGISIVNNLNTRNKNFICLSHTPEKFENKIIHFGSHYLWLSKYKFLSKNNKYIVSFFHGNPDHSYIEKKYFIISLIQLNI